MIIYDKSFLSSNILSVTVESLLMQLMHDNRQMMWDELKQALGHRITIPRYILQHAKTDLQ